MTATDPEVVAPVDDSVAPEPGPGHPPVPGPVDRPGLRARAGPYVAAAVGYVLLSLGLWWHVWTAHPTTTTTCGCGDSSLFQWFLAWPAHAIAHGLDPWYSAAMFHPHGINLLANTAVVGIGTVLAPVTWLFGPIATFNVALGLAPVLSALTMFLLLRRWVSWSPAAFFGGLLYGFSPFILIGLTDGHLMLSMLPMPPLFVLCLDELLARQRRNPVKVGVLFGVFVAIQFFIGTEVLIMVAIMAAGGLALVLVYALIHRDVLVRRGRHAVIGLATAAATSVVLLAIPTWFALAGPAYLSGPIWGSTLISYGGTNFHDLFLPGATSKQLLAISRRLGGYQAPTLSGQYVGIGLVLVLAIGIVIWRRDLRLWLFAIVGVVAVPMSMGLSLHGSWTLWSLFVHLPLMDNVIPSRFILVAYLCAGVMLGLILDHLHASEHRWGRSADGTVGSSDGGGGHRWLAAGSWVAPAAALVALGPIFAYYAPGLPFTTQPVVLPTWFRTVGPHLDSRQVVLTFPVPFAYRQSALTWQAVDGMSYSQAGGGGPESTPFRAGKEEAGQIYLGDVSLESTRVTPAGVAATRQALDGWRVTTVVVPDPRGLPLYEQLQNVRGVVVLITAATGTSPVRQADAWVWPNVVDSRAPLLSRAALTGCQSGRRDGTVASIRRSVDCVLAAAPSLSA